MPKGSGLISASIFGLPRFFHDAHLVPDQCRQSSFQPYLCWLLAASMSIHELSIISQEHNAPYR
jgi:hypothetical protein